ncbi:acyl carrier protein [Paenibacillus sp. SI8]|uniref:acyl carrier protein n=1 Tax=unclassified Paenibacillus TaxID=185978 RepID=UPI003467134B
MKIGHSSEEIVYAIKQKISSITQQVETNFQTDVPLRELGVDSVKTINLIVQLEQQFGIRFEDEELMLDNSRTIEKLAKHILNKLFEK